MSMAGLTATLNVPERPSTAVGGKEFAASVSGLPLEAREQQMYAALTSGNIPRFLRKLCPVQISETVDGTPHTIVLHVTPDYLAVGSDEDYFLAPMSPGTAQALADRLNCSLPTRKVVNRIYESAAVKLSPQPQKPGPDMVTVPVFSNHNEVVYQQRKGAFAAGPLGALTAGHKKDVVISARCAAAFGKVAIFGWHRTNGVPIQPLYLGHTDRWVDYSQCIRLVSNEVELDGNRCTLDAILTDPHLCQLVSDEGPIQNSARLYSPSLSLQPKNEKRSDRSD